MKCAICLLVLSVALIHAKGGIFEGERSLSAARTALNPSLSKRVSSSSSRARAGGWKPRARVTTANLQESLWRRQVASSSLTAPLLLEGQIYFFEDNFPAWNVTTDAKEAREVAKLLQPLDYTVEPDNKTCVFANNGSNEGRICAREAALKCTRILLDQTFEWAEGGAGDKLIPVTFFCFHNETCSGWDCTEYYDAVDSGVTFAIASFCFLVALAIIFLLKECFHAYKIDKQFRDNIVDHQPLYFTARNPPMNELNIQKLGERKGRGRWLKEFNEDPLEVHHLTLTMNLPSIDEVDDDDDGGD